MISTPMQNLAASSSTVLLQFFGVKMSVSASYLKVTSISGQVYPIQVAEACSGMRSLMAFVALGVAMAYVEDRPFWQRLIIMVGGVPIALACNILRVAATCTMFVIDKRELGEDFMHNAMGMVLLIPALLLLMLLARLLNSIYVEVDEDEETPSDDASGADSQAPEVQA
jgi:exosortase